MRGFPSKQLPINLCFLGSHNVLPTINNNPLYISSNPTGMNSNHGEVTTTTDSFLETPNGKEARMAFRKQYFLQNYYHKKQPKTTPKECNVAAESLPEVGAQDANLGVVVG